MKFDYKKTSTFAEEGLGITKTLGDLIGCAICGFSVGIL